MLQLEKTASLKKLYALLRKMPFHFVTLLSPAMESARQRQTLPALRKRGKALTTVTSNP
jgi:hypothetical protein